MDRVTISLLQSMDFNFVQRMQDAIAQFTGACIVFIDSEGACATQISNKKLKVSTEAYIDCVRPWVVPASGGGQINGPLVVDCEIGGKALLIPLHNHGAYLGCWVVGQIRGKGCQDDYAAQNGYSADEAAEIIPTFPIMDEDKIKKLSNLLYAANSGAFSRNIVNANVVHGSSDLDRLSLDMILQLANLTDLGIYVADYYTGQLLMVNDIVLNSMECTREELLQMKCWQLVDIHAETFCSFCPKDKILDDRGKPGPPVVWESYLKRENVWLRCTSQAIYWIDGRLAHMVAFVDISAAKVLQEELTQYSYMDKKLNLPNRAKLTQVYESHLAKKELYLVFFDIVSLKNINNLFGRRTGDLLLEHISSWITEQKYPNSQLYRLGGDEFCVTMENVSLSKVKDAAIQIYKRFGRPWRIEGNNDDHTFYCDISMGIIRGDKVLDESDSILGIMERTLEAAREKGSIAVYDKEMDKEYKEHIKLQQDLKNCVMDGMKGFSIYYQPVVDPISGRWIGLEALCRWVRPGVGDIPPLVFIDELEQMGLMKIAGRWILETAVGQCKAWKLDEIDNFTLDVNISAVQLSDEGLGEDVKAVVHKYDYPCEKLILEITESVEVNFSGHTMKALDRLAKMNIKIALDDFGTGYSSFHNLKNMPVSILKTEKVFIDNIENDHYLQHLFYLMVELAHAADMNIIAEGVENEKQMEILIKNSADYMQGYYFSRPLPVEVLSGMLKNFYVAGDANVNTLHKTGENDKKTDYEFNYNLSSGLYKVLNYCIQAVLYEDDVESTIHDMLERIGASLKVSRACMYIINPGIGGQIHRWEYLDGKTSRKENCTDDVFLWLSKLNNKGMIAASNVSYLDKDLCLECVNKGVKSIAVVPFQIDGSICGFMSMEEHKFYREWLPEEILILKNVSAIITSVMKKNRLQNETVNQRDVFMNLLNSMEIIIYISDIDTDEVIFANHKCKEIFGQNIVERRAKCYEVFYGRTQVCEKCPARALLNNAGHQGHWESYNHISNSYYKIFDSIIPWLDGKQVHLCYFVDITSAAEYKKQLDMYGGTDQYTNVLNSISLHVVMENELRDSYLVNKKMTVCFLDFDNIRAINEKYGWEIGSRIINIGIDMVKKHLLQEDSIGRFGSDKFIILFSNCAKEMALTRMIKIQKDVATLEIEHVKCSFSFGLVENGEVEYAENKDYLEKLIAIASSRKEKYKKGLLKDPHLPLNQ